MPKLRQIISIGIASALSLGVIACESAPKEKKKTSSVFDNLGVKPSPYAGDVKPNPHRKIGKPYKVAGIWYYPEENSNYRQEGVASWYGPKFHGRKTANGEIFDMERLSAAHPTLPLPSIVKVTNLENGKSVQLRVNDRGPFAHDRLIDLSKAAASQLDFRSKGLAKVRVEFVRDASLDNAIIAIGQKVKSTTYAEGAKTTENILIADKTSYDTVRTRINTGPEFSSKEDLPDLSELESELALTTSSNISKPIVVAALDETPPANDRADNSYLVQVGSFSSQENASQAMFGLAEKWPVRSSRIQNSKGAYFYRVVLGPFSSSSEADTAKLSAINAGFSDALIVEY